MLIESTQHLLYVTGGAFLLGWIVGKVGAYFGYRKKPQDRDPRDDRIRSLEAENRVALGNAEKATDALEGLGKQLEESDETVAARDRTITEQLELMEQMRIDLKESVLKTRELREELQERATENVRSEVKLREVETELSVAQASTDLIATGVLDYSTENETEEIERPQIARAASGK